MQTAINIFTVIGSIIGIISFLMTMFSSIHNYNIKKWEKLSSIIDFYDFEDFSNGAGIGIIYSNKLQKFGIFIDNIRKKTEIVQFKGFAKKKIDKKFIKILIEADKFHNEVQVPKWDIWGTNESDHISWKIDKDYFDQRYNTVLEHGKSINDSISNAYEPIKEISKLYREIYALANKLPYEFIFKFK